MDERETKRRLCIGNCSRYYYYSCKSDNMTTKTYLGYIYGVVLFSGRPTVTPSNKSITAVAGQPLTLTMEFCANPPYNKVFWIAKNQKVYRPGDADNSIIAYRITVRLIF